MKNLTFVRRFAASPVLSVDRSYQLRNWAEGDGVRPALIEWVSTASGAPARAIADEIRLGRLDLPRPSRITSPGFRKLLRPCQGLRSDGGLVAPLLSASSSEISALNNFTDQTSRPIHEARESHARLQRRSERSRMKSSVQSSSRWAREETSGR